MSYSSPGVYVEDTKNLFSKDYSSDFVGAFMGITQRGDVGVAKLITSWNSFLDEFAQGMSTPFFADSLLAYSVYGFFNNGGKVCYVQRVAHSTAALAAPDYALIEGSKPSITAKDKGAWANSMTIVITANADNASNFDISLSLGGEVVEVLSNLSNTVTDARYWVNFVNAYSKFITAVSGSLVAIPSKSFIGGIDGVSDITDADYTGALANFDSATEITALAIPGETSDTVLQAIETYCENRRILGILDAPEASVTASALVSVRATLTSKYAVLVAPWGKVKDPISTSNAKKLVPPSGHVMGEFARTARESGVWKAPAGNASVIRGFVELPVVFTNSDIGTLNLRGIIPLVPKTNIGIVVWGARTLSDVEDMRYVTDTLLDSYIRKTVFDKTQAFVFEVNDSLTWARIRVAVETILDSLWRKGALQGDVSSSAYYVKCDADNNTAETIAAGQVICEVGYAAKKPGEFIIFRFSHQLGSN